MPTISSFYGILIKMFFNDHSPAHFHAEYAEHKAIVDIATLTVLEGYLPKRAQEMVLDWARLHQSELLENWRLCHNHERPKPITPLS
jgi:hypothetical protein